MSKTSEATHDGKVVRVTGDKLTTTAHDGTEHHHTVAKDAAVTHDGKACKAADLKAGAEVRVTTHAGDKSVATRVASGKAAPAAAHAPWAKAAHKA